jgi:hypothetical protein
MQLAAIPIATILVPIAIAVVAFWLLRKILHVGFLLLLAAVLIFGWWFFFIRA